MSYNRVIIAGNITQDIELRYTPSGAPVCNISLALNEIRTVNEEKVEEVTFVEVTVWNKTAENLSKWQKKGSKILVEGRLKLDTWDDKDTGKKRSRLGVVADRIEYLGSKADEQAQQFGSVPASPINQPSPTVGQGVDQQPQPQSPVQQVAQPVPNIPENQAGFVQPTTPVLNGEAVNTNSESPEVSEDDIPF